MEVKIEPSWNSLLSEEFKKTYFAELVAFVRNEYKTEIVYPPGKKIFSAFDHCPIPNLKVVIIGQDPYHGAGQANGLCFSVSDGIKPPPSLVNIFKEIESDLWKPIPNNGNLERWAKQGILLLNATLTVRANTAGSHQNRGWETFTDRVIELVSQEKEHVVFILWGAYAQKKAVLIDSSKHFIIMSPHPSPFSAHSGFFGSKPFSKANNYLKKVGLEEINW
jgi:uracil-DNA glycosylase